MSLLPLKTFASPDVPIFGSGGGGGNVPADITVSSITASQYAKSQSFLTSTIGALALGPNQSTLLFAMPNDTRYSGMWSFNAAVAQGGGVLPKANGAIFSVAGFENSGNNKNFNAITVAQANNGYPISIWTSGQNNVPPYVYITNPTGTSQVATVAWHQMG